VIVGVCVESKTVLKQSDYKVLTNIKHGMIHETKIGLKAFSGSFLSTTSNKI
jgi:hypothetical protein